MITFEILVFVSLLTWIYLALAHGKYWEPLIDEPAPEPSSWPSVDIVIPARNESDLLPQSLGSLLRQDYLGNWRIVLVDDHSDDGTGALALLLASDDGLATKTKVIAAPDLPEGWGGKVSAMHTGFIDGDSDYVLFTDADIEHPKDGLSRLVARSLADDLDLNSLMVKLNCKSFAEKFLIPLFVYFFAMLFPFRRVNDHMSTIAAAAGGVMLVKRKALIRAGGFKRIKSALIDDCALARIIKESGGDYNAPGRIHLALTNDTISLRPYPDLESVKNMIVRSAFTQLRYSALYLAGAVAELSILFFVPLLAPFFSTIYAAIAGYATWVLMSLLYLPMARFYGLSWVWVLTLPFAAFLYVMSTIDSALKYWQGKGGLWKGRAQAK